MTEHPIQQREQALAEIADPARPGADLAVLPVPGGGGPRQPSARRRSRQQAVVDDRHGPPADSGPRPRARLPTRAGDDGVQSILQIVTDDMPFLVDSVTNALADAGPGRAPRRAPPARRASRRRRHARWRSSTSTSTTPARTAPSPSRGCGSRSSATSPRTACAGLVESHRERAARRPPRRARLAGDALAGGHPGRGDHRGRRRSGCRETMVRRGRRPAALAGRRQPDLPRLPRVRPADHGRRRGRARPGAGHRARHPQRRGPARIRSDGASRSFAALPPAVRALAREPKLLVLSKANSRSTVHRSVYLDYIGVKSFDTDGRVVGERRFLGLYSSSAYTQSILDIPILRNKYEHLIDELDYVERLAQRQGPAAVPRDLPARRAVPDARRRCWPRSPGRCCTCRSAGTRSSTCGRTTTGGSCPAWSTCPATATRRRCGCASSGC